jgi:phosphate transport system substrate-binding protein
MATAERILAVLAGIALLTGGCEPERKYSPTEGHAVIGCDEAVEPVVRLLVEDFQRTYDRAAIDLRMVQAREGVADFAVDSVRRIVLARALNPEERQALKKAKMELTEYRIALDAIAVIGHRENPLREMRMGMLDSIFNGTLTRWPGRRGDHIEIAAGDVNSSTNEVFRDVVLRGRPITDRARTFGTTRELLEFVRTTPRAIGIVGLAWLRGFDQEVRVFSLGTPGFRPDSTQQPGLFYPPVQAYVYRGYYPITRSVYIYSREVIRDVGYGFISYATSATGQKVFLENGLVPVTMPVRLVEITSKEIR